LRLDFELYLACPRGYEPDQTLLDQAAREGRAVHRLDDPARIVQDAHVVNTDVWASMGQEEEARERLKVFYPYQVNDALMKRANSEAIVLHCLPAHRDEEITDGVLDGPQSAVWDQAENRLHLQKALLEWLLHEK
jgi:ornithine carbamoyltransferase